MKRCGISLLCAVLLLLTACSAPDNKHTPQNESTSFATAHTTLHPVWTDTGVTITLDQSTVTETDGTTTTNAIEKTTVTADKPNNTTTEKPKTTTKTNATVTTQTTTPIFTSGEMRATWVSYIELDAMFRSCSTAAQAKKALDGILDTMADFRLNTLFFHVRANSDAYYSSSSFKPAASVSNLIKAGFDPLSYVVDAAHKRGIAVHAWVNPYRAGKNTAYVVSGVPTLKDASSRYYYVPTSAAAQQLILNGVRELVNNYAVDGIQYDDYFYPPDVLAATTVYNFESADYNAYKQNGGTLSVADWRRAAVDTLIAGTHTVTKAKNRVFGVSPAVNAQNTYDKLYANPKKWMAQSGYIDYICPQIYTGFEHGGSAFDKMTDAWLSYPRHSSVKLYVGIATYKAGLLEDTWAGTGKTEWKTHTDILKRSVLYLRSKKISGFAFYSYTYLKPDTVAGLSATNDVAVARKEIENLRTVL